MNDYEYDSYYPRSYGYVPSFADTLSAAMFCQKTVDTDLYTYPQNLHGAIELIRQAVEGEAEDRAFYTWLMDQAPSEEDLQIITGIRDDEINHDALLRQIYYDLTGGLLPQPEEEAVSLSQTYCQGLALALSGEQNTVERYRRILYAMQSRIHLNMLIGIMTDEIRHGILFNYLYSRNGCTAG
ncbi:ferritin-like domain-containing protein [Lachnospiraceae bacterium 54-53]